MSTPHSVPVRQLGPLFRSRVGRRLLLLFALCALVPLGAFGLFSYRTVGAQLESQLREDLRRESKAAGMGILERLLLVEHELSLLQRGMARDPDGGASPSVRVLGVRQLREDDPGLAPLLPQDQRHLEGGASLLRVRSGDDGRPRILLARRSAGPGTLLVAEVDPRFLWALDYRDPSRGFSVLDTNGAPLLALSMHEEEPIGSTWTLPLQAPFRGGSWQIVTSAPRELVFLPVARFRRIFPWMVGLSACAALLASLVQIRRQLDPIRQLRQATRRFAAGELEARAEVSANDEFGDLGRSFDAMATSISRHIQLLTTLNSVGTVLSTARDAEDVADAVVRGAMLVTQADAVAFFTAEANGHFRLSCSRSRGLDRDFELEAEQAASRDARCLDTVERVGAERCALRNEPGAGLERNSADPIRSRVLALPLSDHEGEVLGVLQLTRAGRGHPEPFSDEAIRVAESLVSQAAVALTRNQLAESFKGLFEGLIELTVEAIDAKSAHTGEHCRRVPILCEMITEAACRTREGALRDFELSEEEHYELRIAALLHDCGKVTTPVHVMDKATKMETIVDRIALVDARFEILRRDAELRRLRSQNGGDDSRELEAELAELEDDRRFLHLCNVGVECMPQQDQERVRHMASKYAWRNAAGEELPLLSEEEVENLTIERGTLTQAERRVIQDHVVMTVNMLEKLPFPRSLRNVPAIAGAHHERVDGSGYPQRLRGEQLTTQSRILGLADVFEALTAQDRPYKPGRTLAEAISILESMRDKGTIDADLFELFLREKIHLRFAADFLPPDQIDDVFLEGLAQLDAERALRR